MKSTLFYLFYFKIFFKLSINNLFSSGFKIQTRKKYSPKPSNEAQSRIIILLGISFSLTSLAVRDFDFISHNIKLPLLLYIF